MTYVYVHQQHKIDDTFDNKDGFKINLVIYLKECCL